LRRNWKLVQHESLNFVVVDSRILLSRENPETEAHVWSKVFLRCLETVPLVFYLVYQHFFHMLELNLVLLENNGQHLSKFDRLLLIFLLSENDHFLERLEVKHFALAFSL
jgi:hypothetical protein